MNRRLLVAVGAVVTVAMAAALVLVVAGALPQSRTPAGCDTPAQRSSTVTSTRELRTAEQLVFSGRVWEVRTVGGAPTTVGEWAREQVEIRPDGALVLRQQQRDGVWYSAEVHSVHRGFGYGVYEWTIESPLGGLDPVVVLGLFTFEFDAPGGREIDIEAAQWGDPKAANMNFVSWFPDRFARTWSIDVDGPTTHRFIWGPDRIVWCSFDAAGEVLAWASRRTTMAPGAERVHMNLWITQGRPPTRETKVVITDFQFQPLAGGALPPRPAASPCSLRSGRSAPRLLQLSTGRPRPSWPAAGVAGARCPAR